MLREEDVIFDAHKAKKCSFTTSRPLVWSRVIENHIRDSINKRCLKQYKSENGLYVEYLLCYDNDEEKKVTINIYVKTGVILIQGEFFQQWAEKIFPLLKASISRYADLKDPFDKRLKRNLFNSSTRRTRSKSVGNLSCFNVYNKFEPFTGYKDMGALWKENIELKKGLESLERDYDTIKKDLEYVNDRGHCYHTDKGKVRRIVEVSNGKKVSVYSPMYCNEKVEARSKVITESAQKLEKQISDMRGRLQDKIYEIQNTINDHSSFYYCRCTDLDNKDVMRIQNHIAQTQHMILSDIRDLKSRVGAIDSTFDSLTTFNPSSTTLRRIEEEQRNIQLNVSTIKKCLDDLKRKMQYSWNSYPVYFKHNENKFIS